MSIEPERPKQTSSAKGGQSYRPKTIALHSLELRTTRLRLTACSTNGTHVYQSGKRHKTCYRHRQASVQKHVYTNSQYRIYVFRFLYIGEAARLPIVIVVIIVVIINVLIIIIVFDLSVKLEGYLQVNSSTEYDIKMCREMKNVFTNCEYKKTMFTFAAKKEE